MKKNNKKNQNDFRKTIDLKSQFKKVETGIKDGIFVFTSNLTIDEFARQLKKPATEIIKYFFLKGVSCNINTVLTEEEMGEFCLESGFDFKKELQIDEHNFLDNLIPTSNTKDLVKRPPIITIMGHVDHGKTTLLDTIRKTKVAASEIGGITQNIGAYQIVWKNQPITFIDTPGHEAFSQMRARGANITDIIVLVVAADDGLKPQTEEAIDHALYAKVPIIVFINKMDKPNPNVERILTQLASKNVLCEEWGGKVIVTKGSALNSEGIDDILEAILLTSEILELKADKNMMATGVTIESHLDKGLGPVANILVQNGELLVGDYILIGDYHGKVRKIFNDKNEEVKSAGPSTPVKICGINGVPNAGDKWIVTKDEKTLKDLAHKRQVNSAKKRNFTSKIDKSENEEDQVKEINFVIKVDVDGSLQALKSVLSSIDVPKTKINIIRSSVGRVTESDVNLAKTAKAILFVFNLKVDNKIQEYANSFDVPIKSYSIIYEIKDEIERLLKGSLDPVMVEKQIGKVEVLQLWSHSSVGTIAGSKVIEGEIQRNCLARLTRNKEIIFENKKITSLRTGKENINSAALGKECGFTIDNFNDFKVGDVVEIYKIVEEKNE